MNLSYLVAVISLNFTGSFAVNDSRDIASYQFENTFDNYVGSFDIFYSFNGTPSANPSIQISTQNTVLVNHQMSVNDLYSGTVSSTLIGGNIYKYSFTIDSIQHTNIYYFKLVNDNNTTISYIGESINFYINAIINEFPVLDGQIAYSEGYSAGHFDGYEEGKEYGIAKGKEIRDIEYQQTDTFFDKIWEFIQTVTEKTLAIFNINILPGIPLYFLILIPIAIGLIGWIFKLLQR